MRESTLLVTSSGPTLQTEEAAEQSGKGAISKILCNAASALGMYTKGRQMEINSITRDTTLISIKH